MAKDRNPIIHYIQPPTEKYPYPRNHSPAKTWVESALGKKTISEQNWVLASEFEAAAKKEADESKKIAAENKKTEAAAKKEAKEKADAKAKEDAKNK